MKLYATVASERASKGQGGNKFLKFTVTDESKNERFTVDFKIQNDGTVTLRCGGAGVMSRTFQLPKAKRQKGECIGDDCKNKVTRKGNYCDEHLKKQGFLR